jgi:hypothetical protein
MDVVPQPNARARRGEDTTVGDQFGYVGRQYTTTRPGLTDFSVLLVTRSFWRLLPGGLALLHTTHVWGRRYLTLTL